MSESDGLFTLKRPRQPLGRLRRGLDSEVKRAVADGHDLAASGIASLRILADNIDEMDRRCRHPESRAYDRICLAALHKQYDETYSRVFTATIHAADPLTLALAEFTAAERFGATAQGHPADPGPGD